MPDVARGYGRLLQFFLLQQNCTFWQMIEIQQPSNLPYTDSKPRRWRIVELLYRRLIFAF